MVDWQRSGDYSDIIYETAEGIAKVTINRPEVRNAFRPRTLFELSHAFEAARNDPQVGVIILTGQGNEAFCSGGDQRIRGDDGYVDEAGVGRLNVLDLQVQMRRLPKPIIAMVAGYAIGGGHVLHVVSDLTVAADNARFGQTGPRVGSFDGGYGAGLLARTVGQKKAREIWYLCEQYSAEEALQMGLVNKVVPLERLEEETVAWAKKILAKSPLAIRLLKASFNADQDGLAGIQQLAGDSTLLYYMSEEAQEGRNAFVEKRPPDFSRFPPPTLKVNVWLEAARPRTLPAGVSPVLVGTAAAETFVWWRFLLALAVGLLVQVGVNYANDYFDHQRGVDTQARVGPRRAVASGLVSPRAMLQATVITFVLAGLAGLILALTTSLWLLAVGAVCFLAALLYSGGPKPYGSLGLGEVFVFVFFGLVATLGSYYVQEEGITTLAVLTALPMGLLATALLVINNLRDLDTDTAAGKKTLAVRIGPQATRTLFRLLVLGAFPFLVLIAGVEQSPWPLLGFLALPLALRLDPRGRGAELLPHLAGTGRLELIFALLLSVGLVLT